MWWLMQFFYGNPLYAVRFISIDCNKRMFLDHIHAHINRNADLDLIEKYGLSIRAAKAFMQQRWFITDTGNLMCREVQGLKTLDVSIPIDSNLDFLSSYCPTKICRNYANVHLHIVGFHEERSGSVVLGGYHARFLVDSPIK